MPTTPIPHPALPMDIPGTPIPDTPDDTTPLMTPKPDMPDIPAPPDDNQLTQSDVAMRRTNRDSDTSEDEYHGDILSTAWLEERERSPDVNSVPSTHTSSQISHLQKWKFESQMKTIYHNFILISYDISTTYSLLVLDCPTSGQQ